MADRGQTALVALKREEGDLQGQLYRALRARILSGHLQAGTGLPSTRRLAVSLGLARATVVGAYERLQAEGYLLNAPGKASRVADIILPRAKPALRATTARFESAPEPAPAQLEPGVPDLTSFPAALWGRLLASQARRLTATELGYSQPFGMKALREAILAHIAITRGVMATPEQVLLFPSTRTAIALIARVVLRRYPQGSAPVWVEDPAYPSARQILHHAGGCLIPVPVDNTGFDPERAAGLPAPKLIYVTPSHQYPTGVTMSLARRLTLLERARQSNAIILEDDYDSEFQFNGQPIAALQGIDPSDCVAYLGTLAKVLAPGIRLAYAIVPHRLLEEVSQLVKLEGITVSLHTQAAFLSFLRDGHFGAHIKRMTLHYAARMAAFRASIQQLCVSSITPGPGSGGLQLALWFKDQTIDDKAIAAAMHRLGHAPAPLSSMYSGPGQKGLLCGIARLVPQQAPRIASDLAALLVGAD